MIEFVENDGGRKAAGYKAERVSDCVCRSICIASGKPYKEVYKALANGNHKTEGVRTAARGIQTTDKWFKEYMKSIGFVWTPTMKIGSGCKFHLRKEELPKGRLVVMVSKHSTAVINGVIHDTHNCSRGGTRCVYGYYTYTGKYNK